MWINGIAVETTFFDPGTLTAVIPGSMLARASALTVTVLNPGQSTPVLSFQLVVNAVLPGVADGGVLNAASLRAGPVAAGELIVINGADLGPKDTVEATAGGGSYPTTLGGTRLTFDGTPAALLAVAREQIVGLVPFAVNGHQSTQLQVEFNGQKSNPVTLAVAPAAPGVFVNDAGQLDAAVAGTVITFLATGGGQTNPAGVDGAIISGAIPRLLLPVAVQMNGSECTDVSAAPAAGMVSGIIQVSARVPADLSGTVNAVLFIGGIPSQPGVTLEVQPADAMPLSTGPPPLRRTGR